MADSCSATQAWCFVAHVFSFSLYQEVHIFHISEVIFPLNCSSGTLTNAQWCLHRAGLTWLLQFSLVVHELEVHKWFFILLNSQQMFTVIFSDSAIHRTVCVCQPVYCKHPIDFSLLGLGYHYLFIGSSSLFPIVPLSQKVLCTSLWIAAAENEKPLKNRVVLFHRNCCYIDTP